MSVELDLFDPNPVLWRLDDKDFLAQRKHEWKSILPRIKLLNRQSDKERVSELKRYFFKGGAFPLPYGTAYWSDILLQCWLHPNPDLHSVTLNKQTRVFPLDWPQGIRLFFSKITQKCSNVADYGLMGGREADIILFYNKGYDFQTEHEYGNGQMLPSCLEPYVIGFWFIRAVIMELSLNEDNSNYIAHSPGLALIDHFDYAMDVYPEAVFDTAVFGKMSEQDLQNNAKRVEKDKEKARTALQSLLKYPTTSGFAELNEKRPASAQRIVEFIDRYEKREFRAGLLKFIDNV